MAGAAASLDALLAPILRGDYAAVGQVSRDLTQQASGRSCSRARPGSRGGSATRSGAPCRGDAEAARAATGGATTRGGR